MVVRTTSRSFRRFLLPLLIILLGGGAAAAIAVLGQRAAADRRNDLVVSGMRYSLESLGNAAFEASPQAGGSPAFAHALIVGDENKLAASMARLGRSSPPAALREVAPAMAAMRPLIARIYWIGAYGGGYNGRHGGEVPSLQARQEPEMNRIDQVLTDASSTYATRASTAGRDAEIGAVMTIALLLVTFTVFYRQSLQGRDSARRLAAEKDALLTASRIEASTDALTGLLNRRALVGDLEAWLETATDEDEAVLALFDLDGFKEYNDTFGHVSGDGLLASFGVRLSEVIDGEGTAYRMGGDEFCLLAVTAGRDAAELVQRAAAALQERGPAFAVSCSYGIARLPHEGRIAADALRTADSRMYERKNARTSAARQSTDVLLAALAERSLELGGHVREVAILAELTAQRLGVGGHECQRIAMAAQLHDVGKLAIPDSILGKPSALTPPSGSSCAATRRSASRSSPPPPPLRPSPSSSCPATSTMTAPATPRASPATRSRSARASSPSPTRSTR